MRPSFSTVVLAAASQLALAAAQQTNDTCYTGAYVIVARASVEPQGYGILEPVAGNITEQIPNSKSVPVVYPATIIDPAYIDSEPQGVGNLTELIKSYGDKCPDGKMILLGYSQGAHVIGDTVIGPDYELNGFGNGTGLEQKYVDQLAAIILMGDPSFATDQSFNVGNSTKGGIFPRLNAASWGDKGVADKMQSYCDAGDQFCDSGSDLPVHLGYIGEYGEDAIKFVVDTWNSAGGSSNSSGSGNSTGSGGDGGATPSGSGGAGSPSESAAPGASGSSAPAGGAGFRAAVPSSLACLGVAAMVALAL